ncbi:MAG: nucleotidyltransferase domain-containing protein [Thermomonas sp.]|uniref:nucleotidyltransferase family protein n=1 Tax=Thermomonas sp. TaxID=1971895 RepID=UPI0039E2E113
MSAITPSHVQLARHRPAIEALCRRHHVLRLDAFGSVLRDEAGAGSDYDFLVEFGSLPDGGYADAYFGLLEGLQALLRAPVDLVVERAIRNPYFRQSVQAQKELVYAA